VEELSRGAFIGGLLGILAALACLAIRWFGGVDGIDTAFVWLVILGLPTSPLVVFVLEDGQLAKLGDIAVAACLVVNWAVFGGLIAMRKRTLLQSRSSA
jgi:hypothetical protein